MKAYDASLNSPNLDAWNVWFEKSSIIGMQPFITEFIARSK